jgi:hypothetical protein
VGLDRALHPGILVYCLDEACIIIWSARSLTLRNPPMATLVAFLSGVGDFNQKLGRMQSAVMLRQEHSPADSVLRCGKSTILRRVGPGDVSFSVSLIPVL